MAAANTSYLINIGYLTVSIIVFFINVEAMILKLEFNRVRIF
jgi:hypothetical protein